MNKGELITYEGIDYFIKDTKMDFTTGTLKVTLIPPIVPSHIKLDFTFRADTWPDIDLTNKTKLINKLNNNYL